MSNNIKFLEPGQVNNIFSPISGKYGNHIFCNTYLKSKPMKVKAITPILIAIIITTSAVVAQNLGNAATEVILNSYPAKLFTGEPV